MPPSPRLIRSGIEFRRHYAGLKPGDAVVGLLPLHPAEAVKLLDLQDRGIPCFPPPLAQMLCRAKSAQAQVLGEFMMPDTFVAYTRRDLAAQLPEYASHHPGPVVAKRDHAHLGLGVTLWPSLEALCSLAGITDLEYPLVVQPLIENVRDLRVVLLGDYLEAYERVNPHSFRKNLFQGGSSRPAELTAAQADFCRRVMARGRFPYAVMDLLIGPQGDTYLSEINLHGGLKGTRLTQADFRRQVAALEAEFIRRWQSAGASVS
jgi:ribosomal protein S6--L-glutamate ligase